MNPLLEVRNLSIQFPTNLGIVQATRDVSFHVDAGEILGLVGESGCGKSITAQALLRLLPKNSQTIKGEIYLEGENLLLKNNKAMEELRGNKIGMIFQDPMTALNPTMRIGKQIIEGLLKHGRCTKSEAPIKAYQLLEKVGIADAKQHLYSYPHELSGGMRQRIMIAIALACEPILLVADEPTTALDVTIQAQILELLQTLQHRYQMAILLITHDLGVVAKMCDRVLVMYAGKIVESGKIDEIFYAPQHPYTQALLESRRSIDRKGSLKVIPGAPPSLLNLIPGCPFFARCEQRMAKCEHFEPLLLGCREKQVACWLYQSQETT